MPDGGELTLSTGKADGFAGVGFQDTGVGIREDVMQKIFESLFNTKPEGTGLWLEVSQQIVMKQRDSIRESSTPDKGLTFTVKLPFDIDGS